MTSQIDQVLDPRLSPDGDTLRAAGRFLTEIGTRYDVREAYLFGSRALGTHHADSDTDVAVVLRGEMGDRGAAIIDMAGIAFDVLMECDIHVQVVPLWEGEFDDPETCSNPTLVRTIRRDGVRL